MDGSIIPQGGWIWSPSQPYTAAPLAPKLIWVAGESYGECHVFDNELDCLRYAVANHVSAKGLESGEMI